MALFGFLIEQHRVALREGAALRVLAGQPDRGAFLQQRAEGQRLRSRPVDALARLDRLGAVVEETLHRAVHVEPIGHRCDLLADFAQHVRLDAGIAAARIVGVGGGLQAGPAAVEPVGLVRLVALPRLVFGLEARAPVGLHLLDFAFGDDALADQLLGIDLQRRGMRTDRLVHQRLGERRLVAFVVAEAPVAPHVDDDRLLEFHPVFDRDLGGEGHRFRIVAVHVEDQRVDHLRDVGRIGRRARIARVRREADLVVDDEMDRAAGAVALQARQAEAFRHDALAGEGGVAVHQERQHRGAVFRRAVMLVLLGAHLAERDGIDDFQMRGVRRQRQVHLVAVELAVRRGAEVILHVARAFDVFRRRRAALELVEQHAVRLAHDLRQHIEAAAMRHADADFLHAEIAAALDDLLERRDQRLAAVEAEALGAGIFDVEEFLEAFGFDELVEDRALAFTRELNFLVAALDALLDPRLLCGVGDVHELDADGLAVGAAQDRDDLAHRRELDAEHLVEEDLAVHVGFAEAVGRGLELFLVGLGLDGERIELGVEVAANAVGTDQHQRVDRIARRLHHVGGGEFDALRLRLGGDLLTQLLFGRGPVAVERGDEIVVRTHRPVRRLPGRAFGALGDRRAIVLQALEEIPPFGVDSGGVLLVAGVEVFDVGGVAAVEERGAGKKGVGVLAGHVCAVLGRGVGITRGHRTGLLADPVGAVTCSSIYDLCKSTKDQGMNPDSVTRVLVRTGFSPE